jgi:uncharacterized protein GlcG (DUF336 family)
MMQWLRACENQSDSGPLYAPRRWIGAPRVHLRKETHMTTISLAQATVIVDAALAKGREKSFDPLTVVVLDSGGHVVAAKREDRSGILRFEIAFGKAWGALGFGLGSRSLATRATKAPMFVAAVASVAEGRMVPVPGGVLIRGADKNVIGAVGISGDTSDNDEMAVIFGIESAGLVADPGV